MRYTIVLAKLADNEAHIWCYASTPASEEAAEAHAKARGFTVHRFPKQTIDADKQVLMGVTV